MEVKPGYKQTDVGVIPEEWEVKNLSDVSRKITDGDHVTPKRTSQGYYLLSARNVLNGRIDVADVDYVGAAEYQRMKQRCGPEAGDILISCSGTIGRVTVVPAGFECVLVRSAALAKIDHELADGVFLQFWLQGSTAQGQIASSVNQGAQPNLFLNHIERLACPHPPLPEQRAIATALSDVDALLAALDHLIAKQRDLKQAAMQQLLTGQTRLPGFKGEWEEVSLGELFTFKNGLNKGKEFFGFGTPIVNYMDVFSNSGILCSKLDGRVSLTNQETKNFDVRRGDVMFTRTSETPEEIGMASVILDDPDRTVFSGFVLRGRPKDDRLCDTFKAYCFRSSFVRKQIVSKASYTTRALTNGRILSAVLLPIPPLAEQTAIAAGLTDMDAALTALEQRRDKTRALKQGMMQELLTGRTRLV